MASMLELLRHLLLAIGQLMAQPMYYIGIFIIIWQYRRQIALERKLYHTRLHSLINESWRMLLSGWIGGVGASLLLALIGISLQQNIFYILGIISLLLLMFHVRYMCIAYSAGVIGLLHMILGQFPHMQESSILHTIVQPIVQIDMVSLLAVVAAVHLAEAVFVRFQGGRLASPMRFEGKRGKMIGGYQLQGFWAVPLFITASTAGSWGMIAVPVFIGYTVMTKSRLPADKMKQSSSLLLLFAVIIFLSAALCSFVPSFIWIASLLSILLHEALVYFNNWHETKRSPLFTDNEQGLTILAVIPESSADEMGLLPGEIIHKVNQMAVLTKRDLYDALQLSPVFIRMEVINLLGQNKFVNKSIYEGEHHQLGIILCPDSWD